MVKRYDSTADGVTFDNLIFSADTPVKQKAVTIASGQGKLAKGTALAINSDDKMVILGTAECTANCILAEDVDATSDDIQALAFITGHFNKQKLVVKTNYTMTYKDTEDFRKGGIFLSDAV